ncbi:SDR family oxidoreductase [Chitinophaga alhagiae]|uniref:SDR family oxidoreductase n=1 Tax=Chitinophaga alhagiae TaxID=2203219 RepID=UPI000E5A6EF5|nr:SDR family oxidoreductase [Chitinophaga alhagiae]
MNKVLLAGSTGYLGGFILKELVNRGFDVKTIVRSVNKLPPSLIGNNKLEIVHGELTDPKSIENCCRNIDVVISTVGITKQKDGLTYMDVDYQANLNLLDEAKRNGVKKFMYVSVLDGDKLTHLKICEAKERFVFALKNSGLDYCVIRPSGYFSDMGEFYEMAQKGRVYLFGDGNYKMNPIHGEDLAIICVDAMQTKDKEIPVGGPQTLTYNQIAEMAFAVSGRPPKITHIPLFITKAVLLLLRTFTSVKFYGPIEFFMTVLTMDLVADERGTCTLKAYFEELKTA